MEKNLTEKFKYNTNVPRLVLSISYIAEMIAVLVLTLLFKFSDVLEFEFGSGVITSDFGYFLLLFFIQIIFFGYFIISYGIMAYRNHTNKMTRIIFFSYFAVTLISFIIVMM